MDRRKRVQAFRELAVNLDGVDHEVYKTHNRDPLEPIFGEGDQNARIALFGRDPGREEVRHGLPFIGAGGQKVRAALHQVLYGTPPKDFEAARQVGDFLFWANTVPYKPTGNKAWSMAVKKRFQPLIADLLFHGWHGTHLITLGREAFFWFAIGRSKSEKDRLGAFWSREDRFEASLDWTLEHQGAKRAIQLHPLPHPSPLNAVWFSRFPDLLQARLKALALAPDHWKMVWN